jgi:putative ABC transport system permease protein
MVVFFACGIAATASVLIALVPALQASALRPVDAIKTGGGRGSATGFEGFGARGALVAAQMMLAIVLVAGAGLMLKSVARLHDTGIGVSTDGLLTARIDLPSGGSGSFSGTTMFRAGGYTPERRVIFFTQLTGRLRALPGVESVGLADCPPVSGGCSGTVIGFEPGRHRYQRDMPGIGVHWAAPEYFATAGIALRKGRVFTSDDRQGRSKVVLVNEAAVRAFWPNVDPIGKRITLGMGGFEDGAEVVGVVSDVRYTAIETAAPPGAYIPFLQSPQSRMRLFVRSGLDEQTLAAAIRRELRALDSNLPLTEIKTMEERVGDAMWRTRVAAWLLSSFAALALLLTSIGIFGVLSQIVAQRTPEIGVRMALGAQKHDVLRVVLMRAAALAAIGIVSGIALALALTRVIAALLYQVEPGDPQTLGAGALLLAVIALLACYLPARRATRVDPIIALRYE